MITLRNYVLSALLLICIFGYTTFFQSENKNDGKIFSASDASAIGDGEIRTINNKTTEKKYVISKDRKEFVASVLKMAVALEGVPYLYAGKSPKGFDCSGFVHYVFKNHNIALPASSSMYDKIGKSISLKNAQKGDIICFTGTDADSENIGHVGIIVENTPNNPVKFIHASSGKAHSIVYSILSKDGTGYYAERFRSVRRIESKN
jgi:cell wall-associated NlpC family hydrolase